MESSGGSGLPLPLSVSNNGEPAITPSSSRKKLMAKAGMFMLLWLTFNVGVALMNKGMFAAYKFRYPAFVSAIHMLCTFVVAAIWHPPSAALTNAQIQSLRSWYSLIFTANILVGNMSINVAPLSLVQVVRACIPAITMGLDWVFLRVSVSRGEVLTMIPVCAGIMLTVRGAMNLSSVSMLVVVFVLAGAGLSSLKGTLSSMFLGKVHPLEMLYHIAPVAALQMLAYSWLTGELDEFYATQGSLKISTAFVLLLNGLMAAVLNVTNFYTNRTLRQLDYGAAPLTIGGNVKQALTIGLGIAMFSEPLSISIALGIFITLLGAAVYSLVSFSKSSK